MTVLPGHCVGWWIRAGHQRFSTWAPHFKIQPGNQHCRRYYSIQKKKICHREPCRIDVMGMGQLLDHSESSQRTLLWMLRSILSWAFITMSDFLRESGSLFAAGMMLSFDDGSLSSVLCTSSVIEYMFAGLDSQLKQWPPWVWNSILTCMYDFHVDWHFESLIME